MDSEALDIRRRLGDAIGDRTLTDFANEVGVSPSSLARWMKGKHAPSRRLTHRIARRYPDLRDVLDGARMADAS